MSQMRHDVAVHDWVLSPPPASTYLKAMMTSSLPVLVVLLYLVLSLLAHPHPAGGVPLFPWDVAVALAFGLVVRRGRRWVILAFAAPALAGVLNGTLAADPVASLGMALVEAAACFGWASLLRPGGRRIIGLERPRAIILLIAAGAGLAATLAVARLVFQFPGIILDPIDAALLLGRISLGHLVGILLITPFMLLIPARPKHPRLSPETLVQAVFLAAIAWEVFARFVNDEIHFFYLLFLPMAWIAIRHGLAGVAAALAALCLAPIASDLAYGHLDQAIVELQIRLAVLAMTSLLLGAMVSERRLSEARLIARQSELAHFQRLNVGSEMASALAHELNQPLTAAMNYVQAALRMIRSPAPDLVRAGVIMEKGLAQVERMGEIIHGLREFMRKGELNRSHNEVGEMIEEAVRLTAAEANAAGVSVSAASIGLCPPVMADRTQTVQVLVNLVRNAIQALAGTGRTAPVVRIFGQADGSVVMMSVADNGPGLSSDVAASLFTPFITTKESGMGLGLSISKSIIEAHGGRLWGENGPGGGAVFRFTLPIAAKEAGDA